MSTWRVVLTGGSEEAYLVHVNSESRKAAETAAEEKVRREYGAETVRDKHAERVYA